MQRLAEISAQEKKLTADIAELERTLGIKKESYAKAVRSMSVRRDNRYDALMFVLSASSLEQAYRRFRYLQEFSAWRKQEAKEIVQQRDDLNRQRTELLRIRKEQGLVLALRTAASEQLIRQQREQRTLVAGLRKKERALKQELKKQQQQADALGRRIQQVIEEEARKAAAAAAAKKKNATQKSTAPSGYLMSKDEEQLSRNFAQNRGKLPDSPFGALPHHRSFRYATAPRFEIRENQQSGYRFANATRYKGSIGVRRSCYEYFRHARL